MSVRGVFAKSAEACFAKYGDQSAALAKIAVKNHANALNNPYAQVHKALGFEHCNTVSEKNPMIAPLIRLTDCASIFDGAAGCRSTSSVGSRPGVTRQGDGRVDACLRRNAGDRCGVGDNSARRRGARGGPQHGRFRRGQYCAILEPVR